MRRRQFVRALTAAAAAALLSPLRAMAADSDMAMRWQSTLLRDHPLVGRIWDARLARFVERPQVIEGLRSARFSLLGEVHDNADHHALQAALVEGLAGAGVRRGVVFEQFDREFEPALRKLLAGGKAGAEEVAEAVSFDRKGWNWDFYKPIVEIALRSGWPLATGNLSRKDAMAIARQGLKALDPARAAALDAGWSAEREAALVKIIVDGHCGMLPASAAPPMALAQRARDATLAEAMRGFESQGAVLIAGNGHTRRDLGVPVYLQAAAADAAVCAVGIVEVQEEWLEPAAYLSSAAANVRPFDFVCFTPRHDRPDPCLAFQRPPA